MSVPLALIIASASELGKLALQSYFQYARMSGMTPEQMESTYQAEKTRFQKNAPDTLGDVPPDSPDSSGG
jgi:hypothetical protein